jgi:glycosyltransferase involved in cell wall biosynthesis
MKVQPKILTFVDYYLPGYKAGGPIRALQNLVDNLYRTVDFYILTRCHDQGEPDYKGFEQNQWLTVGFAKVQYLSRGWRRFMHIMRQVQSKEFDQIYLNSFFSIEFSVMPLLANWLSGRGLPVTLAPRGEFCAGAIELKTFKKLFFIRIMRAARFYSRVTWQASTQAEVAEIHQFFPAARCHIARELAPPISDQPVLPAVKVPGELHLIFISRISRKKNLDFAIKILDTIKEGAVSFDIYGPIEDPLYWQECLKAIETLGSNISVNYCGDLKHADVMAALQRRHVFFLPTLGENFGYAILEAFFAGRPVIVSDTTPWRELERSAIGFDLPLVDEASYTRALRYFLSLDQAGFDAVVSAVASYIHNYRADFAEQVTASEQLFLS